MPDLRPPPLSLLDKHVGTDFLPLYTATVRVNGGESRHGRASGVARSDDGALELQLRMPEQLGGPGGGTNPEQLFAAGYAACFHSALQAVARSQKVKIDDSSVGGRVQIGPNGQGGYQLAVLLEVVLPGLEAGQAQALADAAHQVCPYSNATRGNIDVQITVSED